MMRFLIVTFSLLLLATSLAARPVPFTTKEVGLMLRSGYPSEAVMNELSKRRFADTVDGIE